MSSDQESVTANVKDLEYETQFFDIFPTSVIDEAYNVKYDYVHSATKAIYNVLAKKYPSIPKDVLKKGVEGFRIDIMKTADKTCDKLEAYLLNNVFNIPTSLVLPEDEVQMSKTIASTDEDQLDSELFELRRKIQREVETSSCLKDDVEKLDELITNYQAEVDFYNELKDVFESVGGSNLEDQLVSGQASAVGLLECMNALEKTWLESTDENKSQ